MNKFKKETAPYNVSKKAKEEIYFERLHGNKISKIIEDYLGVNGVSLGLKDQEDTGLPFPLIKKSEELVELVEKLEDLIKKNKAI